MAKQYLISVGHLFQDWKKIFFWNDFNSYYRLIEISEDQKDVWIEKVEE